MSAKVVRSRLGSARTRQVARKILVHVGAFISLALVGGVLWVLYHILDEIQLSEVMEAFQSASLAAMVLAVSITIASYFVLTGYDVLALNHINRPLPYPRTALASFLAYAFGNNIGFSLVTGTSIRYRIYTPAGLSATEIAAIAVLCAGTFALGTIVILALGMLVETHDTSETLRLPSGISRTTSIIVLMAAAAYLLVTTFRPIIIRTGTWSVRLPSARIALAQLALAALDLTLVATVLYVLLPVPTGPRIPDHLRARSGSGHGKPRTGRDRGFRGGAAARATRSPAGNALGSGASFSLYLLPAAPRFRRRLVRRS
jgi:uncharacterized membrane protein YbhN (UPF0104 family)